MRTTPIFTFASATMLVLALSPVRAFGREGQIPAISLVSPSPSVPWIPPADAVPSRLPATHTTSPIPPEWLTGRTVLPLSRVLDLALSNSPETRAAWFQARAAAEDLRIRKAEFFPEIDLGLGIARQKQTELVPGGEITLRQTTFGPTATLGGAPGDAPGGATATYTLFDFGGRKANVDDARAVFYAANWSHSSAVQNLVLQVELAYFSYQNAKAQLAAATVSEEEARKNLDSAEERHNAGVATIADVLQAKTALSQARLDLASAEGLINTVRGALVTSAGFPASLAKLPIDVEDLPSAVRAEDLTDDVEKLIEEAEVRRPDLAAARETAVAALAHVRFERSQALPTLGIAAAGDRTYYPHMGGDMFSTNWSISALVKVPLFNGFQSQATIRKAEESARADIASAEAFDQQVILQVWSSYANVHTAHERLTAAGDLLESAVQSESVAAGRYRNGVGTFLDLLAAQSALASARAQEVQARADWFQVLAQLAHDTGVVPQLPGGPATSSEDPKKGQP